jgi:hypothetical protein
MYLYAGTSAHNKKVMALLLRLVAACVLTLTMTAYATGMTVVEDYTRAHNFLKLK